MRSGDTLYVGSNGLTVAEVNEILHEGLDVGSLCTSTSINRWAKWKPFEVNAISFVDKNAQLTAMKNVNMGLSFTGNNKYASISSNHISSPEWDYTGPSTWFRLLDFAPLGSTSASSDPGYCHSAVCPLNTWWPDSFNNRGVNNVKLFADQEVNVDSSSWNSLKCVSFLDCVNGSNNSDNNFSSYYFALLIADNSGGTNSNVLLSSGITVADLSSSSMQNKLIELNFCADEAPSAVHANCKVLPPYTFGDTKIGHSFDVAWVLAPLSSSDTYITSNFPQMISLNLENGINMSNIELVRADAIDGLEGNAIIVTPILSEISNTREQFAGYYYRLYKLNTIKIHLDVTNAEWTYVDNDGYIQNRTSVYISFDAVGNSGGQFYIVTSDVISDPTTTSLADAAVIYGSDAAMRSYTPGSVFSASITKSQGTNDSTLDNIPSSGCTMPDIYFWIREGQSITADIEMRAFTTLDRTTTPYSIAQTSEIVLLDTESIQYTETHS